MQKYAYLKHPVTGERKAQYVSQGFRILDLKFAPDELQDGDHVDDNAVGSDNNDNDWIPVKSSEQLADGSYRIVLDESGDTSPTASETELQAGTDSGEQFSDEQLREIITEVTGAAPHHKTGRAKLVEQFNELNAGAADNSNDTGDDNDAERNSVE